MGNSSVKVHVCLGMLRIIAICISSFPEILDGSAGSSDAYVLMIADGQPGGVPVSGGPEAAISSKQQEDLSFKSPKEFVFAYRVREICCGKAEMENRAFVGWYPSRGCYCKPEVEDRVFAGRYQCWSRSPGELDSLVMRSKL